MSDRDDSGLLHRAQQGDRSARERLVAQHLEDVRSVAGRYRNLGLVVEDLVQEGSLGLLDAIDHYDEARGTSFDVYARFRIRRAIRNALTDTSRLIRLPKQLVERIRALDRIDARLTDAKGQHPSAVRLAEESGLSVATVRETRALVPIVVSLDQPQLPDGSPLESLIVDERSPDPPAGAAAREETVLVDRAVDELPPRQREIVSRHFGVGCEPEEVADLAAALHLSQQRVRTIERDALYALRDRLDPYFAARRIGAAPDFGGRGPRDAPRQRAAARRGRKEGARR
jgi:RNA polymerase sigma factor (sigma-70 family)